MTEEANQHRYISMDERESLVKAAESRIPEKLLEIDALAYKAWSGFFTRGGYDAASKFRYEITNLLHDAGWPVFRRGEVGIWQRDSGTKDGTPAIEALNSFADSLTDPGARTTLGGQNLSAQKYRRNGIPMGMSFDDDFAAGMDFITKPENIATLEKTVNSALETLKKEYGDPLVVKDGQRSLKRAFADAAMSQPPLSFLKGLRGTEAKARTASENSLIAVLKKDLLPKMRLYNAQKGDQWVPGLEFQGRTDEVLKQKFGWDMSNDSEKTRALREMLWSLASASEQRTTLVVRLTLQDDTSPPNPHNRAAKDFILAHSADIAAAAKEVAEGLDKELASPDGVTTRFVEIAGRKNKKPAATPPA